MNVVRTLNGRPKCTKVLLCCFVRKVDDINCGSWNEIGIFAIQIMSLEMSKSGWVVTWFLLGYTVRMFEYTVRTFWSNVGRFLYVFSSIPRKLYTIFQPTFSPIKRYQDGIFKLLTLSTNSVTNVVRTAYFQTQARSSPLEILWQSLYSK